jgi:hypothetical protein
MNGRILLILICLPISVFAQNLELGLGGGVGINSNPSSNMPYKFDKATANYNGSLKLLFNFSDHIQAGLEGQVFELSGIANRIYTLPLNGMIGGGEKFIYAKKDLAICGLANARTNIGRGYLYAGLALGYGMANGNDFGGYSLSGAGKGIIFGAQTGYVVGITGRIGAFIELGVRYNDLKYSGQSSELNARSDWHYHIMSYPCTIGIRYRILNTIMYNFIPKNKGEGQSRKRD